MAESHTDGAANRKRTVATQAHTLLEVLSCVSTSRVLALTSALTVGSCSKPFNQSTIASADVTAAIGLVAANLDSSKDNAGAFALVKSDSPDEVFPILVERLSSQDLKQKRSAIYLLGMLRWNDPKPAFDPLRRLLIHKDSGIRGAAVIALASLGDVESHDKISNMLAHDEDPYVRQYAVWSLGELGQVSDLLVLRGLPHDTNPGDDADSSIQPFTKAAIDRLEFLRDHANDAGDAAVAAHAVWSIAGSSMDQTERLERAIGDLRMVNPEVATRLLDSWVADRDHSLISSAARLALELLNRH